MQTIPRLIRWIVLVALFFFIVMFLLRLATWVYFAPPGIHATEVLGSFWLGFRFDAREVGIVCLLMLILGSIPALHPLLLKAVNAGCFYSWVYFLSG